MILNINIFTYIFEAVMQEIPVKKVEKIVFGSKKEKIWIAKSIKCTWSKILKNASVEWTNRRN